MSSITAPSIACWSLMLIFGYSAYKYSLWLYIPAIILLIAGIYLYEKERKHKEAKEQKDREERDRLEQSRAKREDNDNLWKTGRKVIDFINKFRT